MPGKVVEDSPPSDSRPPAKFRRPADELLRRVARRVVRGGKASFRSQAAFREAVLALVRRDEPLATVGGKRLRRLLIGVPGVRLSVHYTERPGVRPPEECPVCGGELTPIRNRTLTGDSIVLGQRCARCDYWTHGNRRVPVRYVFSGAGIDGRSARR
ncbi:MAG: hypothetical protein ACLQD8_08205 [Thermoplasmata archaeon]